MAFADNPHIASAREIRAKAESYIKELKASGNYTPTGLREVVREDLDKWNKRLKELHEAYETSVDETRARDDEVAFNLAEVNRAGIVERRDAALRADDLTRPQDASRLLAQAIRHDDASLIAEVVRRAIAMRWESVLDTYTEEFPDRAAALERVESRNQSGRMGDVAVRTVFRPIAI